MVLYVPPFARTNAARPATPESSSSSSSSRSTSPGSPHARQSACWHWKSSSGELPSPPTSPSSNSAPASPPEKPTVLSGNWRRATARRPTDPDYVVGRVVLLPNDEQVPATSVARRNVQGAPWNHPAVITKVWEADNTKLVKVRTCTSFHGIGIAYKQQHHHRYFVEASKSQLRDDSDEFVKQTWVNCSPDSELTIEAQHLCIYTGRGKGDIQFDLDALHRFNWNERVSSYDNFY